jgi:hypothetical protein
MAKQNLFFGANIPFADIALYYNQGTFSYLVFQPMIPDGGKPNDDYTIALWAVDNIGAVMNGYEPIILPPNKHFIEAKKKVHFANVYVERPQLENLFKDGQFTIGLAPISYAANKEYVSFEIFNADKDSLNYTALSLANPSPPASRTL